MTSEDFLRKHGAQLSDKTPYERLFVEAVLDLVPDLPWRAVLPQRPFNDSDGRTRRIDFTIEEGEFVRIAIEVDGYDKTGRGTGMTRAEFADWSRREQEMTVAGYRVIRVANSLIDREPRRCARTVELVLKRERELAARLRELPAGERPAAEEALRKKALPADEKRELNDLAEGQRAALRDLERQLEAAVRDRDRERDDRRSAEAEHRNGMLSMVRYFVIALVGLAAVAVAAVALLAGGSDSTSAAEVEPRCADARDWSEAGSRLGERGVFKGTVVAANHRESTNGSPTFLDVGERYPSDRRLVVLVWGRNRDGFPTPPETAYTGKEIAIEGQVDEHRGTTQIEAESAGDITVCG